MLNLPICTALELTMTHYLTMADCAECGAIVPDRSPVAVETEDGPFCGPDCQMVFVRQVGRDTLAIRLRAQRWLDENPVPVAYHPANLDQTR